MNLQTRLEIQGITQQWVDSFMQQYNISPSIMEDALNKVLCNLKDKVILEFLAAAQAQAQQAQQVQKEDPDGSDTGDDKSDRI